MKIYRRLNPNASIPLPYTKSALSFWKLCLQKLEADFEYKAGKDMYDWGYNLL